MIDVYLEVKELDGKEFDLEFYDKESLIEEVQQEIADKMEEDEEDMSEVEVDEIEFTFNIMAPDCEEVASMDTSDMDDLDEIFEVVEKFKELRHDDEKAKAIIEWVGLDEFKDCNVENYTFYNGVEDDEDLGKMLLDGSGDIPTWLEDFVNYEAYGDRHSSNACCEFTSEGYIESH